MLAYEAVMNYNSKHAGHDFLPFIRRRGHDRKTSVFNSNL